MMARRIGLAFPPVMAHPRSAAADTPDGHRPARQLHARQVMQWITEQATARDDGVALLDGFCTALHDGGLPLWRMSAMVSAIDPSVRAFCFDWQHDLGASLVPTAHEAGIGGFERMPVYAMLAEGRTSARWRLRHDLDPIAAFPSLMALRAEGGTDYIQHIVWFTPGTALKGLAVSFATDTPSGFGDDDLAVIAEVLPALGLAMCKFSLSRTLHETLATYLGAGPSVRVLEGHIRRGDGETVAAAILLADFRGFTALTDRGDPVKVVGWLDEHFDAIGEPVTRCGGEILKFTGDGFLAIFPVEDPDNRPCATCGSALDAAEQALAANRALNARRRAAGLPTLDVDLVLHFGEVIYGNIGTSRRLDFTVIGRAVNEASRIEALCDDTDRPILVSGPFAERCTQRLELVGTFALRGLERKQQIWAPVPSPSASPAKPRYTFGWF
ncbi:adenylate/guanylate cyclase domain-containing protein [Bradyrhizobium prioriisuperbiae]|uniref:adenylate/guanylate cyclase domain-containing protein n=1 Tax=Bradyrhizobium prioriisuperbiae TaxID=2854389 RepID=UPI0028E59E82|nr:adenylate/guanylate cyclase domain-containing protein [Bradyrhizobium prioritasuperba]